MTQVTEYRDGEELAAAHATMRVPVARPDESIGAFRERLAGVYFDSAADVAVCEGDRLVGLCTIEQVFAAAAGQLVAEIMDPDPPFVSPGLDREKVAWQMVRHGESAMAVVDEVGRFAGLIPPQRMLTVLLEEHDEDVSRLSGVLHAREAAVESVGRRLWHRLPWLFVGLVGALVAAGIVGAFEDQLARRVILTFFIPGVVYMADAVGTQTEAVVIRGLSVGIPLRAVLAREAITGLLIGVIVAAVFVPMGLAVWGEPDVVFAVGLALLVACSIAAVVAMTLPPLFDRFGLDPAFGSGPLATVIQDLLSIVVYCAIVVSIAG